MAPVDYDSYQRASYFTGLDGLRGLSALMVLSWHMSDRAWLALRGGNGVFIFFVLSGFLITSLLLREEHRAGSVDLRAFYLRRLFRIAPLYYLVLGIYCLIAFAGWPVLTAAKLSEFAGNLPLFLCYLNEFMPTGSTVFGHSWSLGVEEKYYLVFPLLILASNGRPRVRRYLLAGLSLGLLAACAAAASAGEPPPWFFKIMVGYLALLAGALTAIALHHRRSYQVISQLGSSPAAVLVLLAMVAMQAATGRSEYALIAYPIAASAMIAAVVTGRSFLVTCLEWRPLRALGQISYGFYLIHVLALHAAQTIAADLVGGQLGSLMVLVLAAVLAATGAALLFILIERPLIQLGRRLAQRRPAFYQPALEDAIRCKTS